MNRELLVREATMAQLVIVRYSLSFLKAYHVCFQVLVGVVVIKSTALVMVGLVVGSPSNPLYFFDVVTMFFSPLVEYMILIMDKGTIFSCFRLLKSSAEVVHTPQLCTD